MNTASLKRFAQSARRKLLEQVTAKLDYVMTSDSAELREKSRQIEELRKELQRTGKTQLIDKVAYTWFNRLVAIRFMDVNDYQPTGIRVITPSHSFTQPQAITEAKQGNIPTEWKLNRQKVFDLLDGRIPAFNPQNEVFRIILVAACNHLNTLFPFLFEKIDDYTELLLPDDLTSQFSILHDVIEGMTVEDCREIEVIGWLYQFYISEKKDEVFASKNKVKKEDIPAATQLFTPRWIVEYMVQNTIGKLWLVNKPSSGLKKHMPYYINPVEPVTDFLKINGPAEITLLDQASGSGHILVYGFELLYRIYEEEGYSPSDIPALIIENNLFGFEIDSRAAQLAGFALMMKARRLYRNVFRKELKPHIYCFSDLTLSQAEISRLLTVAGITATEEMEKDLELMRQATNYGSLIQPLTSTELLERSRVKTEKALKSAGLFDQDELRQLSATFAQLAALSRKFTCVVDNPPYMGGGNLNKELSDFVKNNYPDSKADLMACFMECGLAALKIKGYLGMINQHSWMFLSSYEKLREKLLKTIYIETLLHLGPRTFPEIGGEVVQNAAFTFVYDKPVNKGNFIRLVDLGSSEEKRQKTLEAITNHHFGRFYLASQSEFKKIPGSPIGYWLNKNLIDSFENLPRFKEFMKPMIGMRTGDNLRFLRFVFEIEKDKIRNQINNDDKWVIYNKAGGERRWYGLLDYVVNWENSGYEIKRKTIETYPQLSWENLGWKISNELYYFVQGITWSDLSTGKLSARLQLNNSIFDSAAPCAFPVNKNSWSYFMAFLNTKVAMEYLDLLCPSLHFNPGGIKELPIIYHDSIVISELVHQNIKVSKSDWDSHETSFDFELNELLKYLTTNKNRATLEDSYLHYRQHWTEQFFQLHLNEEELNRIFIETYGLQEGLTSNVLLEEITILQEELDSNILLQINQQLNREQSIIKVLNYDQIKLPFNAQEVMAQFVSYAVGCMFGRYSLDKPGSILANQGETLSDYVAKVQSSQFTVSSFLPDEDNVIPVLDDDWFEDDITGRFRQFLKASFGTENYEKNVAFVEQCLGKDIRSYFVRDFYPDHIRRYKKRPIYWMFSSPRGSFSVLIYMHRYTPDTVSTILNGYLRQYQEKLRMRKQHLQHVQIAGTNAEKSQALRETERIERILLELHEYERDILYPLAAERIAIDLDDGVLVNYNRFGKAVKEVAGLNDSATKKKVKEFDWVDTNNIR